MAGEALTKKVAAASKPKKASVPKLPAAARKLASNIKAGLRGKAAEKKAKDAYTAVKNAAKELVTELPPSFLTENSAVTPRPTLVGEKYLTPETRIITVEGVGQLVLTEQVRTEFDRDEFVRQMELTSLRHPGATDAINELRGKFMELLNPKLSVSVSYREIKD